jgi:hypothetical protein
MMQALLNLINILFQSTRKPKFQHPGPGHCPISNPFLLTLHTPMAHQIYHYTLILPILLHYLGLYRRTTYLESLPHIRTSMQGFTPTENTRTKVGGLRGLEMEAYLSKGASYILGSGNSYRPITRKRHRGILDNLPQEGS